MHRTSTSHAATHACERLRRLNPSRRHRVGIETVQYRTRATCNNPGQRSRVNFFMNKFRKLGLIEYNGGLTINSSHLSASCTTDRLPRAGIPGRARLRARTCRCRFENTSRAVLSGTLTHGGTGQAEPSIRRRSRDRERGISMPNNHIRPEQHRQQAEGTREKAEDSRRDAEQDRGFTEEHRISAESARNEAEQFRRLAEEAREIRDQHREALETVREDQERLREAGEAARTAGEDARAAADAARHAAMDAVHATAETLHATLEHMKVVEEMRRTLSDIQDVQKRDAN